MPIPTQPQLAAKIDRKIALLQAERTGVVSDLRRIIQKAHASSQHADNGLPGARERALVLVDLAYDRGLAPGTIKDGPNLTAQLAALLDRTPALDHCCGMLYEAADLLAEAGRAQQAATVFAIAEAINTAADLDAWRRVNRPMLPFSAERPVPPAG